MIEFDVPIEVNQTQYDLIRVKYAGVIAHRTANNRYWIKLWAMRYKNLIEFDLKMVRHV